MAAEPFLPGEPTPAPAAGPRAEALFRERLDANARRTDRMFAGLMVAQWAFAVALALLVTPRTWAGAASRPHAHLWAAVVLGGLIASLPLYLCRRRPGAALTRHVVAAGQILFSALLIHLTGGRIETHFHVFGSLAFLAFYRDWRVLATATAFVALDHGLRGVFWPESVYGVSGTQAWRFVEHTAWVLFEDAFLVFSISTGLRETRGIALQQAELEKAHASVERKVARRTAELQDANERLARSNADLEQFAFAASHDLKEPLRKMSTYAELLGDRLSEGDEEARRMVERCVESARRMSKLVDSLLRLARLGVEPAPRERVDTGALLDRVGGDIEVALRECRGIVSRTSLPEVEGNPTQLGQVLQNLLENALKFRGPQPPRVHVSAERAGREWVFRVRDNGIGVDPALAGQLFVMFKRLHSRAEYPGAGIGLAVSRRIVEQHGGRIWVEPRKGPGACFCFTLPAGEGAAPSPDGRGPAASAAGPGPSGTSS